MSQNKDFYKMSMFERVGAALNPSKLEFEQIYVCPNYAIITLKNGNISECVRYLRELVGTGLSGMREATEQLTKIKYHFPERHEYIIEKVYSFR